jgi:ABC-type branched-subunit amino acid transport system substrate-binding protein
MRGKNLPIILGLFIISTLLSSVHVRAERGVTDTEIHLGTWGPLTGPAALWGAIPRGTQCFFDMINAEGGIHGRKIVFYVRDDGYMPPKTKAIVKELVENKGVFGFASGVGTATGMAVKKYLHNKKVPWVSPASGSSHWAYPPTRYLFSIFPLYCDEGAIMANYAMSRLGKRRIAYIYQNDDFGREGDYGITQALKERGMDLVARVPVELQDTDLSSHCMKLKSADPDCVIMYLLPKHGAIILQTAAKMGFKTQWMSSSVLSDTDIMYKISKGLFKDVIFTTFAQTPDSRHPLLMKYKRAQERFAPNERWGIFFYAGFGFVEVMVEGLKRCGRNLTAENFVEAMESIKDFQGIGGKISFGPNRRQGTKACFIARCVEDGKIERLSEWMTSDIDVAMMAKALWKGE